MHPGFSLRLADFLREAAPEALCEGAHALAAGAVDAGGAAQAWEAAGGDSKERNKPGDTVFVREYEHGKMVRSEVLTAEELELVFAKPKLPKKAGRKRRVRPLVISASCCFLIGFPMPCELWPARYVGGIFTT